MNFVKIKLLVITLVMFAANSAFAALSYNVSVDTSAYDTTNGYLFFTYIPVNALDSTATVSNFKTDFSRLVASPEIQIDATSGNVTGQLPGTVTFQNLGGLNDYTHGITFGKPLSFDLTLANLVNGSAIGTSTFSLTLQDSNFNDLAKLFTVDLNADGIATSVVLDNSAIVTATPIPAAFWLLGSGLMGLVGMRRRKPEFMPV
jgi:hypothetical protein